MPDYPSMIENGFLILGSFIMAIFLIIFCWSFVNYVFYGGDDAHRAHAKTTLLNVSINMVLLLVLWWICTAIAGNFPA